MTKNSYVLAAVLAVLPLSLHAGVKLYDLEGFVDACLSSSSELSRPVCECAAKRASEELSPAGFEFLVATLRKEKEKSLALRHKLEQAELATAGAFMATGPARCAEGLKANRGK